jgi:hypothetical protein
VDRYAGVIGGKDVDSADVIDVLDRATGEVFAGFEGLIGYTQVTSVVRTGP